MRQSLEQFTPDPNVERWLTPTALIIANLVPIAGVLFFGWDAGVIVMLYWAENLVIGLLTIAKMLRTGIKKGLFTSLFFIIHYGGFCAGHGMIAGSLFDWPTDQAMDDMTWPFFFVFLEMLYKVIQLVFANAPTAWFWGVMAIAVSHTLSYVFHHWFRGEDKAKSANQLMAEPYGRIVVLHIAVIAGGLAIEALGSPLGLLLVLIALKIGLDTRIHMKRHKLLKPA